MGIIRVLFLSDTHLGFDMPLRPRIERRRRGPEFFNNYMEALKPAFSGEVDCVVHGGDILFRSKVPPDLVLQAFEPLAEIASNGIPVYVVPGNHERSAIPYRLLAAHPDIHIFDEPRSFIFKKRNSSILFAGFPYERDNVRGQLPDILSRTGWQDKKADISLLCIHHCVEGATAGPQSYTFRHADDVIRIHDLPRKFSAVLAGHIHRFQVLRRGLDGSTAPAPVFYAGSTERTSFQERIEEKGYLLFDFDVKKSTFTWEFKRLDTRPMHQIEIDADGMEGDAFRTLMLNKVRELQNDSIVKLIIRGNLNNYVLRLISASSLRYLFPAEMNIEAVPINHRQKG